MADLCGAELYTKYDRNEGVKAMEEGNYKEVYLNNTWRPNLSITGAAGLPDIGIAGNVVRGSTSVRLSMRLPPSADP